MLKTSDDVSEVIALVHYYGRYIANAGCYPGTTREDVLKWSKRVQELGESLPPSWNDPTEALYMKASSSNG